VKLSERRAELLTEGALRFLATAQYVAKQLENTTDLDWSAAVIGVCKALEVEFVHRLVDPIAGACNGEALDTDVEDKDLSRVARYCAERAPTPPELGTIRHFLHTARNSRSRQDTSVLLRGFRQLSQTWPAADWLLDPEGAPAALDDVTRRFRNRAAHTDELEAGDFTQCWEVVAGGRGALWNLLLATSGRKDR
jgi:hypothetical protein